MIEESNLEHKVLDLLSAEEIEINEFVHVFNEDPSGLAAARNQAVAYCSGDYILFLYDDYKCYPTKIKNE